MRRHDIVAPASRNRGRPPLAWRAMSLLPDRLEEELLHYLEGLRKAGL